MTLSSPKGGKALTPEQALSRLMALCSRAEHSSADVMRRARQWQISTADAERILDTLVEGRYVDDSRFCRAYTLDKLRYNHWGRDKICAMLRAQGLAQSLIAEGAEAIDPEEYGRILGQVLAAKARTLPAGPARERQAKLIRHATGRGFEPHLVMAQLSQMDGEDGEEDRT